jgi:eukaryotic-like serine/threonine-protein kinase
MHDEPVQKLRVIDWSPSTVPAGDTAAHRKHIRLLAIIVALCVVLSGLALTAAWRVISTRAAENGGIVNSILTRAEPAEPSFVSRARAEFARETATRALVELRKLPLDHPRLLQELTLIEKNFLVAERYLTGGSYTEALRQLEAVNGQVEEFTETVTARKQATEYYDDLLRRLQRAERVRAFAPELYEQAFTGTGEGRMRLEQGAFLAAREAFEGAVKSLNEFESRRLAFIEDRLWEGQQALSQGVRPAAEQAFHATLKYDAGNEAALRGLKRATTIERVHALLLQAREAEERADYAPAIEAYQEAFKLDAFSIVAQQGEARARQLQQDAKFDSLVTAAKAAEGKGDWANAVARYGEALGVYPKREDIKAALENARAGHHQAQVQQTLATAYDFERAHDWPAARDAYLKLLELEANHPDAVEGLVRVGRVMRALVEYTKLVEVAQHQLAAAQFQPAISTFNAAMQLKPDYLPLSEDVVQLRSALEANNQPVEVKFKSDGRTWVSISSFKLLGRIKEASVKLPPGDYEVVGRRKKFQDVVFLLRVRPTMATREINVICENRSGT